MNVEKLGAPTVMIPGCNGAVYTIGANALGTAEAPSMRRLAFVVTALLSLAVSGRLRGQLTLRRLSGETAMIPARDGSR
jgi:hypothetical protein